MANNDFGVNLVCETVGKTMVCHQELNTFGIVMVGIGVAMFISIVIKIIVGYFKEEQK